ncbi:MAG: hypothetical protein AAGA62_11965, partial [Bacteroidota bacterium]
MLKIIKIALPFLLVGGLVAYQFMTPKGPLDIHAAPTELTINAGSLFAAFAENEETANASYVGKVIEVSGQLNAIEQDEAGAYQLKLAVDDPLGQVICSLAEGEKAPLSDASIGKTTTIKGVCTGYLFDVVIDN